MKRSLRSQRASFLPLFVRAFLAALAVTAAAAPRVAPAPRQAATSRQAAVVHQPATSRQDATPHQAATSRQPTARTAAPAASGASGELAAIAEVEDRRDGGDPRLAAWMAARSPVVRARAALALGRIGAPRLLRLLIPALLDADARVRAQACFAAGLIADSSALDPLRGVLAHDSEPEVRRRATEALSRLGSRRAAPLLGAALTDPSRDVRYEASVGLWRLQDSSAVDSVLPHLGDPDPGMRWRALYALERSGSRRAPSAVRALAADPDASVRMIAARALGRMKDFLGEDALERDLSDPSWQVRVNAAVALGLLADSSRAPSLVRALGDSSGYVRQSAATALGLAAFSGASDSLRRMARVDAVAACRAAAAVSLVQIHAREHPFAAAREALTDSVPFVRAMVLEALGEAKDRDAWDYAGWALANGPPRVKSAALEYFGSMQDGHALPWILAALHGSDDLVAGNAAETLGESGDSTRVHEMEDLYAHWPGPAHVDARLAAVNAAARLWARREPNFFRAALRDPDRRVREAAALGLRAATGERVAESMLEAPLPASGRPGWFGPEHATLPSEALIRTTRGTIRLALERDLSPNTVANFVRLARRHYFDGLSWHRVVPNFVIQGGDPHGDGQGGPGYTIRCEMNMLDYDTGRVGMALDGKDTGGSQFFITQSPQPHLNGRYTIFARVLSGMDVVDRIQQGDRILSIRLLGPGSRG